MQNSATGIAIQAPIIPKKLGRISNDKTMNPSERQKEIIAETLPFDKAVKNPDDVMLIPLNKKLMEKIWNPVAASS